MLLNETFRASSCFHHSTRALAPGESLPPLPSLFEQVLACRNAMLSSATEDEAEETLEADLLEEDLDDEIDG